MCLEEKTKKVACVTEITFESKIVMRRIPPTHSGMKCDKEEKIMSMDMMQDETRNRHEWAPRGREKVFHNQSDRCADCGVDDEFAQRCK